MTNEEIIEELLIEASNLGLRGAVISLSKQIKETNPKMDNISSIELALKLCKNKVNQKVVNKEEMKHWINRWKMLKQSPQRDMTIKIWSNLLKKYE